MTRPLIGLAVMTIGCLWGPAVGADVDAAETHVEVSGQSQTPSAAPASTPTWTDCEPQALGLAGFQGGIEEWLGVDLDISTTSPVAWQACTRTSDGTAGGYVSGLGVPVPATDLVVAHARSQLHLDAPDIATSPPRGGTQLVGIPIWFWLERRDPIATTATIPNLSATLTATPTNTRITIHDDTNDDTTLDCPDGGRPWTQGRDDPRADGPCSHTFTDHGTTTIDATVTWTLTWTATNGQTGTLEPIDRTTTFTLTIEEAQAVTD